ncbi:MBOAT family protein [Aureisphaera galaxeae]|uniref:MBOAT family O-acyltransferase n=1 Tax=Aureisphaera galaxeae TaxID=1538023 RepID=UPI00235062B7|nr:MBOAT family O-acyltransferase [Aureisphaera galaxeae]MDC8004531.1 MBOAT family protein [Aureisphaera galaxeae]
MLFNSFDFGFFLVIVFAMYWIIGAKRRKAQNILLLVASYVFYGLWDWRFLGLIFMSSVVDYLAGRALRSTDNKNKRKLFLWSSILWNIGVLFTFKYFNFFLDNFRSLFGIEATEGYYFWNVVIPVGLSFYTFQTMSYTIDVYRKKIQPTHNFLEFMCFVSFFPQLVAGPIERARDLLPQFENKRSFDYQSAKEGLRQILWGLFKKILVADKLGIAVTMVFNEPESYGAITLVYASLLFFFQIYCDFSGYTDIAIGTAKLFGFKLNRNFRIPYLSISIAEFWMRWHITLTKWFTDYVYFPILRSRKKITPTLRVFAVIVTMVLVGLWHGANWTFVMFGLVNGIILVVERIPFFKNGEVLQKKLYKIPRILSFLYFFAIAALMSMFFRSHDISQSFLILKKWFTLEIDPQISSLIGIKLMYLVILVVAELLTQKKDFPLQQLEIKIPKPARWAIYYILIFLIVRYAEPKEAFIYFQF